MIAANEDKSDKEIITGQASNVISIGSGEVINTLFDTFGKDGLFKQVSSSVFSGYIENQIDKKYENKEKNKKEEE